MKPITFLLLATFAFFPAIAQHQWSFDNQNVLKSWGTEVNLQHFNVRNRLEVVEGVKGNGLRTDGYSTWFIGQFKTIKTPFTISGWFALESFPTDTAAFFGVKDTLSGFSVAVCVDRFGDLMIGTGKGNTYKYTPVNNQVNRFEWIHLAMATDKGNTSFYLNGKKIPTGKIVGPNQINNIIIARDYRVEKIGIHDLTAINGIVDEVKFINKPINTADLQKEVQQNRSKKPILAVPAVRFEGDFSRPKYHIIPAANWTNETHGLIYYKNRYHIFNQKDASNLLLRQINWGHFSSPDLINWTEHKPAITPEKGYDQNGIWSGHVVLNDEGIPTIIYTAGGEKMGIGIAFPEDDNLINWKKYENNPVVPEKPAQFSRTDPRDPYVWKEGDKWYMAIGFGIAEDGIEKGSLLLYSSPDLKKWDFLHTLFDGNPEKDDSGIFWEMPVFKKIGEKYVLLINKVPHKGVPARAMYWVGDFKNERFVPDDPMPKNLEVINRLLSPSVEHDANGRITAIAIIPDENSPVAAYQQGWAHLYSIPRVWNLKGDKIIQTPHPNLKKLRKEQTTIPSTKIDHSNPLRISEGHHQLEARVRLIPGDAKRFGFVINKNQDNTEYTKLYYDAEKKEMIVDQTQSSKKQDIPLKIRKGSYDLDTSKPIDFHIFIDGSVVEIFVNEEDALTTRIFPLKESSTQLEIFAEEGNIEASAEVWILDAAEMKTEF